MTTLTRESRESVIPGESGARSSPLSEIRVLDLSRALAGPLCTQFLGDYGAEVIKVEPPWGDETRGWGPPFREDGASAYFLGLNRNKRSIALDLKSPVGQEVLWRLVESADVVVENLPDRLWGDLGVGRASSLRENMPFLVHCRITGYGSNTSLADQPAYDAALNTLHPHSANWLLAADEPVRMGSGHPNIVPYDLFECRDGWVFVGAGNDRQYRALCAAVDAPELAEDSRFSQNRERIRNRVELTELLGERIRLLEVEKLIESLRKGSVPASVARSVGEAMDPDLLASGRVIRSGEYVGVAPPLRAQTWETELRHLPPASVSVDAWGILRELGLTDEEVTRLFESGAVVGPPEDHEDSKTRAGDAERG